MYFFLSHIVVTWKTLTHDGKCDDWDDWAFCLSATFVIFITGIICVEFIPTCKQASHILIGGWKDGDVTPVAQTEFLWTWACSYQACVLQILFETKSQGVVQTTMHRVVAVWRIASRSPWRTQVKATWDLKMRIWIWSPAQSKNIRAKAGEASKATRWEVMDVHGGMGPHEEKFSLAVRPKKHLLFVLSLFLRTKCEKLDRSWWNDSGCDKAQKYLNGVTDQRTNGPLQVLLTFRMIRHLSRSNIRCLKTKLVSYYLWGSSCVLSSETRRKYVCEMKKLSNVIPVWSRSTFPLLFCADGMSGTQRTRSNFGCSSRVTIKVIGVNGVKSPITNLNQWTLTAT